MVATRLEISPLAGGDMELVFQRGGLLELFVGRLVGKPDVLAEYGVFLAERGQIVFCVTANALRRRFQFRLFPDR